VTKTAFEDLFVPYEPADTLQYGAWGEAKGGNTAGRASPFGFVGRFGGYWDARLEKNLFWNRWYGPEAGRWGSRDPINIIGGYNLYDYTSENFTSSVDTSGLLGPQNCQEILDKIDALKKKLGEKEDEYRDNKDKLCNIEDPDLPWWKSRYQHMLYILYLRTAIALLQSEFDNGDCNNKLKGYKPSPAPAPAPGLTLPPINVPPGTSKTIPYLIIPFLFLLAPAGA
jgi:RHS repeat-associated protein